MCNCCFLDYYLLICLCITNIIPAGLCISGAVRLQNGTSNDRGRVEICNNDVWGTICDDSWTAVDARVVCIQLGLPSSGIYSQLGLFSQTIVPLVQNIIEANCVAI